MRIDRLAALIILGTTAGIALGAEGRIPIFDTGTVITQQGSYYVTQNIVGTGAAPVISVQSDGVDIDLNGFTLVGSASVPAILIGPADNVRIHGGTIRGGLRAIDEPVGGLYTTIEDTSISTPADAGIRIVLGAGMVVRRVQVLHPGAEGILLQDGEEGRVEEVLVSGSTAAGIRLSNMNVSEVTRCTLRNTSSHGILVDGGAGGASLGVQVDHNNVFSSNGDGISMEMTQGGAVWENTVYRSAASGIHIRPLAREISVRENHVDVSFGGAGILIEGIQNSIERNHLSSNYDWGLHFTASTLRNTYGGNSITGNSSGSCTGTAILADFCNEGVNNASFGTNLVPTQPLF